MIKIIDAIKVRHKVCKYLDKALEPAVMDKLKARIALMNDRMGLNMEFLTDAENCLWGFMKLFIARGVRNFLILSAPDTPDAGEKLGYAGMDIALYAQTLGLNSWWIGETYHQKKVFQPCDGQKCMGVIVLGYGATQDVQHKSKTPADVSLYEGDAPAWFSKGVEAALLAPTAMNKQQFFIHGKGDEVHLIIMEGGAKWI